MNLLCKKSKGALGESSFLTFERMDGESGHMHLCSDKMVKQLYTTFKRNTTNFELQMVTLRLQNLLKALQSCNFQAV